MDGFKARDAVRNFHLTVFDLLRGKLNLTFNDVRLSFFHFQTAAKQSQHRLRQQHPFLWVHRTNRSTSEVTTRPKIQRRRKKVTGKEEGRFVDNDDHIKDDKQELHPAICHHVRQA